MTPTDVDISFTEPYRTSAMLTELTGGNEGTRGAKETCSISLAV